MSVKFEVCPRRVTVTCEGVRGAVGHHGRPVHPETGYVDDTPSTLRLVYEDGTLFVVEIQRDLSECTIGVISWLLEACIPGHRECVERVRRECREEHPGEDDIVEYHECVWRRLPECAGGSRG